MGSVGVAWFLASAAGPCSCGAMHHTRASLRQILWVYALVCVAVFGVTRLEPLSGVGQYMHLLVAALFLLTSAVLVFLFGLLTDQVAALRRERRYSSRR